MSEISRLSYTKPTSDGIAQAGASASLEEAMGNVGGVSVEPAKAPEVKPLSPPSSGIDNIQNDILKSLGIIKNGTENDAKDAVLKLATLVNASGPENIQFLLNDALLEAAGYTNGDLTPYLQKLSAEEGPIDSIIKYSDAHQHQSLKTALTLIKEDYQRQLEASNNIKIADNPVLIDGLDDIGHDLNMISSRELKDSAQEAAFKLFETLSSNSKADADVRDYITTLANLSNNFSQETLKQVLKDAISGNVDTTEDTIELAVREIRGLISSENESLGLETLLKTLAPLKYTLSQIKNNDAVAVAADESISNIESPLNNLDSSFQQALNNLIIDVFLQVMDGPDFQANKLTPELCEQIISVTQDSILSETLKAIPNGENLNIENLLSSISIETVTGKINSQLKELHEEEASPDGEHNNKIKEDMKSWLNELKIKNEVDAETLQSVNDIENGLVEVGDHLDETKDTDDIDATVDSSSPASAASERTEQAHESSANEQRHPHPGLVKSTLNTIGSFFSLLFAMLSGWARNEPGEGRLISQARHMSTAWNAFIASMSGIGSSLFGEKGKE